MSLRKDNNQNFKKYNFINLDTEKFIKQAIIHENKYFKMNSAFTKVSNLKINRSSKFALTIAFLSFFLYALGQAPIFKILWQEYFLVLDNLK